QLARAKPSDIPALLPGLLSCIRMMWSLSKFYNTEERLTSLLRKISNEASAAKRSTSLSSSSIIHRCCEEISLSDIFNGNVESAMAVLNESRACGMEWKVVYRRTAALIRRSTTDKSRHWDFDDASIFAQVTNLVYLSTE
ncbi:unnamed protein product, partial [Discosporangium mesarthrocarpum]